MKPPPDLSRNLPVDHDFEVNVCIIQSGLDTISNYISCEVLIQLSCRCVYLSETWLSTNHVLFVLHTLTMVKTMVKHWNGSKAQLYLILTCQADKNTITMGRSRKHSCANKHAQTIIVLHVKPSITWHLSVMCSWPWAYKDWLMWLSHWNAYTALLLIACALVRRRILEQSTHNCWMMTLCMQIRMQGCLWDTQASHLEYFYA